MCISTYIVEVHGNATLDILSILFTYRAASKKLVRLSEVPDCGLGMLSFPKEGCLL